MKQSNLVSAAIIVSIADLSAPASAELMTGEIQQALVGNTTTQTANNQRYWAYFKDAGTVYLKSDRGFMLVRGALTAESDGADLVDTDVRPRVGRLLFSGTDNRPLFPFWFAFRQPNAGADSRTASFRVGFSRTEPISPGHQRASHASSAMQLAAIVHTAPAPLSP